MLNANPDAALIDVHSYPPMHKIGKKIWSRKDIVVLKMNMKRDAAIVRKLRQELSREKLNHEAMRSGNPDIVPQALRAGHQATLVELSEGKCGDKRFIKKVAKAIHRTLKRQKACK